MDAVTASAMELGLALERQYADLPSSPKLGRIAVVLKVVELGY